MAIGRILPGVAVMNSKIYVVGGEQESQILANGEWYDTQADSWNKVSLPGFEGLYQNASLPLPPSLHISPLPFLKNFLFTLFDTVFNFC